MPFVKDALGMSAVGPVLATVAFLLVWRGEHQNKVWWFTALTGTCLALGLVALGVAETAAAEAMLAAFMASILVVWPVEMIDRALNGDGQRKRPHHSSRSILWTNPSSGVREVDPLVLQVQDQAPCRARGRNEMLEMQDRRAHLAVADEGRKGGP